MVAKHLPEVPLRTRRPAPLALGAFPQAHSDNLYKPATRKLNDDVITSLDRGEGFQWMPHKSGSAPRLCRLGSRCFLLVGALWLLGWSKEGELTSRMTNSYMNYLRVRPGLHPCFHRPCLHRQSLKGRSGAAGRMRITTGILVVAAVGLQLQAELCTTPEIAEQILKQGFDHRMAHANRCGRGSPWNTR